MLYVSVCTCDGLSVKQYVRFPSLSFPRLYFILLLILFCFVFFFWEISPHLQFKTIQEVEEEEAFVVRHQIIMQQ